MTWKKLERNSHNYISAEPLVTFNAELEARFNTTAVELLKGVVAVVPALDDEEKKLAFLSDREGAVCRNNKHKNCITLALKSYLAPLEDSVKNRRFPLHVEDGIVFLVLAEGMAYEPKPGRVRRKETPVEPQKNGTKPSEGKRIVDKWEEALKK